MIAALERLMRRVHKTESCWVFTGPLRPDGYCQIQIGGNRLGRKILGHRLAYEGIIGPIPAGLEIDHLCRNRACVNPAHLEPVTSRVNNMRGEAPRHTREHYERFWATRGRCARGHEVAEAGIHIDSRGNRRCRECHLERKRATYRRQLADPERRQRLYEVQRRATLRYRTKKGASA